MKVAILCESPADEAAIRILIDGLLDAATEAIGFRLRASGWPAVIQQLPVVLKELHYHRVVDGFVVVMDSDLSPVHVAAHDEPGAEDPKCRLCRVRRTATEVRLRPIEGKPPVRLAFGLAVPAIEAWYRSGLDPHVNEAAWLRGLLARQFPYDRNGLKRDAYGTDRPSISLETRLATEAARRIIEGSGGLASLERNFPGGFGALARELRAWRSAD